MSVRPNLESEPQIPASPPRTPDQPSFDYDNHEMLERLRALALVGDRPTRGTRHEHRPSQNSLQSDTSGSSTFFSGANLDDDVFGEDQPSDAGCHGRCAKHTQAELDLVTARIIPAYIYYDHNDSITTDPVSYTNCAYCDEANLTFQCNGCKGCNETSVPSRPGYSAPWYCSNECKDGDWVSHQPDCEARSAAKAERYLRHSAELLKRFFLTWRQSCLERPIVAVTTHGNSVFIEEDWDAAYRMFFHGRRYNFGESVFQGLAPSVKHAVLSFFNCDTFVGYHTGLIRTVLFAHGSPIREVQELEIELKRDSISRVLEIQNLQNGHSTMGNNHTVLRIKVVGGYFVLDPTGAQYGQDKPMMPWDEYRTRYVENVKEVGELGVRRSYYKALASFPHTDPSLKDWAAWTFDMGDIFMDIVGENLCHLNYTCEKLMNLREDPWFDEMNSLVGVVGRTMEEEAIRIDGRYHRDVAERSRRSRLFSAVDDSSSSIYVAEEGAYEQDDAEYDDVEGITYYSDDAGDDEEGGDYDM